ncbi:MAG: hypothetical protein ACK5Z5_08085 [Neisseriaceae bacterium]
MGINIPDELKECFGISGSQAGYKYLKIIENAKAWLSKNNEQISETKRAKLRDFLIKNLFPHWKSEKIFDLDSRASSRAWNLFQEIKTQNKFANDDWYRFL